MHGPGSGVLMPTVTFRNPAAEFALQLALQQQQPPAQPTVVALGSRQTPSQGQPAQRPALGNVMSAAHSGKKLIGALAQPTTSGLTQAGATKILTSPAAYGGLSGLGGGLTTSGLTQAAAKQILTSPAAYGASSSAAPALSALGPAAAVVAMPFIARELFGGGNENIAKADRIFAAGKGEKGPLGIKLARTGDATYLSGSPKQLSKVAAAAQMRDIPVNELRPDFFSVPANLEHTRALLDFTKKAKNLNVESFKERERRRSLQRRRKHGGR